MLTAAIGNAQEATLAVLHARVWTGSDTIPAVSGKLADFVLLDRDLTRIPAPEIRDARVVATSVGGKLVYTR